MTAFEKPATTTRETVALLRKALAGGASEEAVATIKL